MKFLFAFHKLVGNDQHEKKRMMLKYLHQVVYSNIVPVSILYKSNIAGRYWPVRVADGR